MFYSSSVFYNMSWITHSKASLKSMKKMIASSFPSRKLAVWSRVTVCFRRHVCPMESCIKALSHCWTIAILL